MITGELAVLGMNGCMVPCKSIESHEKRKEKKKSKQEIQQSLLEAQWENDPTALCTLYEQFHGGV